MKFSFFSFFAFAILAFASCDKDSDVMTDAELIQAIQTASDKQMVTTSALPADASTVLAQDFTESYVEDAQLAPELGYEVRMRRGTGTYIGERSDVYFNTEGRELREDGDREGDRRPRGEGGSDWEECFELVFPVTFVMPDGTEVSGSAEEVRAGIRAWYEANPGSDERPVLQYPVDIVFEDNSTRSINDDVEMRIAYGDCGEQEAGDFDCPDLRANIGDTCYNDDRTEGTVNADCECE